MRELNKEAIKAFGEHLDELEKKAKPVLHNEILQKLMEHIEPEDSEKLAFPQSEQLKEQLTQLTQLGEAAEKMGVPKYSARYYQFREQLFKQFLVTAYMPTPENDKNMVFINLLNGTFEIGIYGSTLRSFYHEDFLTYQLPFEYNPDLFPIVEPSKPKDNE